MRQEARCPRPEGASAATRTSAHVPGIPVARVREHRRHDERDRTADEERHDGEPHVRADEDEYGDTHGGSNRGSDNRDSFRALDAWRQRHTRHDQTDPVRGQYPRRDRGAESRRLQIRRDPSGQRRLVSSTKQQRGGEPEEAWLARKTAKRLSERMRRRHGRCGRRNPRARQRDDRRRHTAATTTVRHETATDATTVVTGIITPPIPTRIARRFMRIARSPGKRSDDSAFDAVFMPADATPNATMVTPASSGVRITASSGIASATSPDDSASDARYPSASTIGPDSTLPRRSPTNSAEISDPGWSA